MCPIFITLSMTEPCNQLSKYVPPASLFSRINILSMLGLFVIQLVGQIFIVETLKRQTFYTDSQDQKIDNLIQNGSYNDGKNCANIGMLLSSTLFIFTNFLYMGVVLATSISKPFRKEFYTNPYLVANVLLLTVSNLAIPFLPEIVPKVMNIDQSNPDWYVFVVFWANVICLLMYVFERALVWLIEKFP
jgi:cation-transporting ATPase 13A2